MELKIVCGSWIDADDEIILDVLRSADTMPSPGELSKITGLPLSKVNRTLKLLRQQEGLHRSRQKLLEES